MDLREAFMKCNHPVSRRQFFELLTAVGGAAALGGCSSSGGTDAQGSTAAGSTSNTLTIGIQDEPEGLDIQQISWDNYVHWLIYEPMVEYSDDLTKVVPAFFEDFQVSDDGKTYTFTLPKDAKFSNGDAIDANACKSSYDRYLATSEYSSDYDDVESFEVVDDHTVILHLKAASPYLMASLASTYSGIVDVAVANGEDKDAFNRNPVANGPYKVDSWEQGNQLTLLRNENYQTHKSMVKNKGPLPFDTIVVRFIPDEFTRVSEVESGDVDLIFDVPASSYDELKGNSDITLYEYTQPGVSYLDLNTEDGVLTDAAVRQAFTFAIDRDEIVQTLDGLATPTYGYLSKAQACYSKDEEKKLSKELAFDAKKAKKLLKDAGYTEGDDGIAEKDGKKVSVEMLIPSDRTSLKNAGPVIQKQLKAVGIEAKITEQDAAYIKSTMKEGNYSVGSRNYVWNDPDMLNNIFTPNSGNKWENADVTAALAKARTITDTDERTKAYAEAQDLLVACYKAVSLFADKYIIASKSTLSGVQVTTDGRVFLQDASLSA